MKYAVIQIAGKQYKVTEGEQLTVNSLEATQGEEMTLSDVLLTADGEKVQIGTPLVNKAAVKVKVVSHQKGEKIRVAKYKAKSRYRRVRGFRPQETTIEVVSIA